MGSSLELDQDWERQRHGRLWEPSLIFKIFFFFGSKKTGDHKIFLRLRQKKKEHSHRRRGWVFEIEGMGLSLKAQNVIYSRAIAYLQDCYFLVLLGKNNRIFQLFLFLFLKCFSRRTYLDLETSSPPKKYSIHERVNLVTHYLSIYIVNNIFFIKNIKYFYHTREIGEGLKKTDSGVFWHTKIPSHKLTNSLKYSS